MELLTFSPLILMLRPPPRCNNIQKPFDCFSKFKIAMATPNGIEIEMIDDTQRYPLSLSIEIILQPFFLVIVYVWSLLGINYHNNFWKRCLNGAKGVAKVNTHK